MPLTAVIGGQFGGEGKGAITAYLVVQDKVEILVKTGGPNSAHTFGKNGQMMRVRMVPCGANFGPSTIVYPAGCLIHLESLFFEVRELNYTGQILIDPRAGIVESSHIEEQRQDPFYNHAGSTLTGTGAAIAARSLRRLRLAKDEPSLANFLGDTMLFLAKALEAGKTVLVEGSQSFGLSNYHGEYPYTTSRDTTVSSFMGQIGLGPRNLDRIVLVIKCFPTRNRVGDGPLLNELSEDFIVAHAYALEEHGGGTYGAVDPLRRVGLIELEVLRRAIIANSPHYIAVTGLDRLAALQSEKIIHDHYGSPSEFIHFLEKQLALPVGIQAWGPYVENIVDNRSPTER